MADESVWRPVGERQQEARSSSHRRVVAAVLLFALPMPLALGFLILGLFSSVAWVYVSIAMVLLQAPAVIAGVKLIERNRRSRQAAR